MTMTLAPARRKDVKPSFLTPEILAAQAGEYSLRTWRFSWDKDEHTFHLRDDGLNLYVRSIAGYTEIEGADGASGRMYLTHGLVLDAEGNALFVNKMAELVVSNDAPAHQMCFARAEHKWRIWRRPDADLNPLDQRVIIDSTRQIVSDYRGPLYVFWPRDDQGGHIFAATPFEVVGGMAMFGGGA